MNRRNILNKLIVSVLIITFLLILSPEENVIAASSYKTARVRVIASKKQSFAFVEICGVLESGKENCEHKYSVNMHEYNSKKKYLLSKRIDIQWRIHNDPNIKDLKIKPTSKQMIPPLKSGKSSEKWISLVGGRYKNKPTNGFRYWARYYILYYNPIVDFSY